MPTTKYGPDKMYLSETGMVYLRDGGEWVPSRLRAKACLKCAVTKLLTDFPKDSRLQSGRRSRCCECTAEAVREAAEAQRVWVRSLKARTKVYPERESPEGDPAESPEDLIAIKIMSVPQTDISSYSYWVLKEIASRGKLSSFNPFEPLTNCGSWKGLPGEKHASDT